MISHDELTGPSSTPQESSLMGMMDPALTVRGQPRQRRPKLHRHHFSSDEEYEDYKREMVSFSDFKGLKFHESTSILYDLFEIKK